MAKKYTGIEVGESQIRIVEVTPSGNGLKVSRFIEQSYGGDEASIALKELLEKEEIDTKNLAIGIPAKRVLLRENSFPFKDPKKIARALPFSLSDTLPFPMEEAIYRSLPPKGEGESSKVISLVVKKETLHEVNAPFEAAGLSPAVVTAGNYALSLLAERPPEEESALAHLHLEEEQAVLSFITGDGLLLSRVIDEGTRAIVSELAEALGQTEHEAADLLYSGKETMEEKAMKKAKAIVKKSLDRLVREIELARRAFERNNPAVSGIVLSGEGEAIMGITDYLESETGISTKKAALPGNLDMENGIDATRLFRSGGAALGCALAAARGGAINFTHGRSALLDLPLVQGIYKHRRLAITGLSILLVLYTLDLAAGLAAKKKHYRDLNAAITKTFRETLPEVKRVVDEKQQLKTALSALEAKAGLMADVRSVRVVDFLKEITEKSPEGVSFRVTRLRIGEKEIKLEGETANFDGVEKIKTALEKSKTVDVVDVGGAKASRLQNVVEFQLNIKLAN